MNAKSLIPVAMEAGILDPPSEEYRICSSGINLKVCLVSVKQTLTVVILKI